MRIPDTNDRPTVSASSLRTYGAGGFRLIDQEESKGCPRQWKAKYVERRVRERRSYALEYGSLVHRVFYLMEEEGLPPQEALDRAFPPDLEPEAYREALDDLTTYMERGAAPMDRFGTLAVELDLAAPLYVDEEFGETWYRGIVDWLGVDLDDDGVLHVVDYKTNRFPPSQAQVEGDVQLKGYAWLVLQHWRTFMPGRDFPPRVVVHLDAVKWRDAEVAFTAEEIEDWHSWAVAVVRTIWRDEQAEPVLNPGCHWCPVRSDCPAYEGMPADAEGLLTIVPGPNAGDEQVQEWRDRAYRASKALEKAYKEIDARFAERAMTGGSFTVAGYEFVRDTDWQERVDARAVHRVLGDQFYDVVTIGKGKVESIEKQMSPDDAAALRQAFERRPVGTKVTRKREKK